MPGYDLAGLDDTLELSEFGADRFLLALESRTLRAPLHGRAGQ